MSLASFSFFLFLIPALFLRSLFAKTWHWVLILNIFFLLTRGPWSLVYVATAAAATFWAAHNLKGKSWRYWAFVTVLVGSWIALRVAAPESFGLSPSYISFVLLAYLTEVHWGRQSTEISFGEFAAGTGSLSYLTSGPVPEIRRHLSAIQTALPLSEDVWREAIFRILCGLAKKGMADFVWNQMSVMEDMATLKGATFAWILEGLRGARLYADFSGYADIAIGVGLLMGHRLPENFHLPFLATSVSSYWRRWNASVTHWFIAYVFTPLSLHLRRLGWRVSVVLSTLTTLLLVGLWHGFAFTQLIWGAGVGSLIAIESLLALPRRLERFWWSRLLAWAFTLYAMTVARVFSTAASVGEAWSIVRSLHTWTDEPLRYRHLGLAVGCLAALLIPHALDFLRERRPQIYQRFWLWLLFSLAFWLCIFFFSDEGRPFIYEGY